MAMFDDPGKLLRQLEQELKEDLPPVEEALSEEDFFFPDAAGSEEAVYYEEDYRRARKSRRKEKRAADGCGGLRFLLVVELLAIVSVIGGWILWFSGRL